MYVFTDKVGSLFTFGLAHAIYLIVLFLEEVKPQRHILVHLLFLVSIVCYFPFELTRVSYFPVPLLFKAATALLATIVFSSVDHPYETLNKFVWLVTVWYIFALTGVLAVCAV